MAYIFKSLADVEAVEMPIDTATVLIEEEGVIKKAPKTAFGDKNVGMGGLSIVYDKDNDYNILYASEDLYGTLMDALSSYQIPNVTLYSVSRSDDLTDIYADCARRFRYYPEDDGHIYVEFGAFATNILSDGHIEVFYND